MLAWTGVFLEDDVGCCCWTWLEFQCSTSVAPTELPCCLCTFHCPLSKCHACSLIVDVTHHQRLPVTSTGSSASVDCTSPISMQPLRRALSQVFSPPDLLWGSPDLKSSFSPCPSIPTYHLSRHKLTSDVDSFLRLKSSKELRNPHDGFSPASQTISPDSVPFSQAPRLKWKLPDTSAFPLCLAQCGFAWFIFLFVSPWHSI